MHKITEEQYAFIKQKINELVETGFEFGGFEIVYDPTHVYDIHGKVVDTVQEYARATLSFHKTAYPSNEEK